MKRKTLRNLAAFARIQASPKRMKYMLKQIKLPAEIYAKAYSEVKK